MSAGTSDLRRETVKTKVASEALTEQAAQFINEGGRCASHLLFCEFIDNSLHAMAQRRAEAARGELLDDWIEVHLIYDYDTRGGARLTHVAILDSARRRPPPARRPQPAAHRSARCAALAPAAPADLASVHAPGRAAAQAAPA